MAITVAESPEYRSASRCRYGNVNWHTGQEILKKAATTGPFSSNFPSEYSLPSSDFRVKPGATCPTAIVVKGASVRSIWRIFAIVTYQKSSAIPETTNSTKKLV